MDNHLLTIHDHLLHEIRASGPLGVESLVCRLDEQCEDPEWWMLSSRNRWGCSSVDDITARILAGKRAAVRNAMAELVAEGKASVYSNDPFVCWW